MRTYISYLLVSTYLLLLNGFSHAVAKDSERTPHFIGFEEDYVSTQPQQAANDLVSNYKQAIKKLLEQSNATDFYSLTGNCLDYSIALLEKLEELGFDNAQLSETNENGKSIQLHVEDGTVEKAGKTHFFIVDRSQGAPYEIIIDPTIYQFVMKKPSEATSQPIFVGYKRDLQNFYRKNRDHATWDVVNPENVNIGKYDPDELVCLIYSVDQCSVNRKIIDG